MDECELCGRKTDTVYVADVEGIELGLCARCAKGKKVLRTSGPEKAERGAGRQMQRPGRKEPEMEELVDGYPEAIRAAREGMKLPIKVLAEMISEKERLLMKVEEGKLRPNAALISKLEKHLRIKLTSAPEEGEKKGRRIVAEEPTLGDFIVKDKRAGRRAGGEQEE